MANASKSEGTVGAVVPTSDRAPRPSLRLALSTSRFSQYLAAVEAGDAETADRLRAEAREADAAAERERGAR